MTAPLHLIYENHTLLTQVGKIIVAWFEETGTLRVVRIKDGEVLHEEPFRFTLKAFIQNVNNYSLMENRKADKELKKYVIEDRTSNYKTREQ